MKFFNWMQNKLHGGQGNKRPNALPNHTKKEPSNEEFNDWPHGLLAIGTFGNTGLKVKHETIQVIYHTLGNEKNSKNELEEQCSSPDLSEFTAEEVGNELEEQCSSPDLSEFTAEEVSKLTKALTKLLTRKPLKVNEEQSIGDLPLDRFLNCPSSLEVDSNSSNSSNRFSIDSDDKDEDDIDRTIRIMLARCKDVCEKKKKSIGKKSLAFLVKKIFVCSSGFLPTPSLRDALHESRMEKLLRTMLTKKMYPQNASRASSTKQHLEDCRRVSKAQNEDESRDISLGGSKWDKTDSEYIVLEI